MRTVRLFQISYRRWTQRRVPRAVAQIGGRGGDDLGQNASWIMSRGYGGGSGFPGVGRWQPLLLMATRNIRTHNESTTAHRVNTLTAGVMTFLLHATEGTSPPPTPEALLLLLSSLSARGAHSGLFSLDTACALELCDWWLINAPPRINLKSGRTASACWAQRKNRLQKMAHLRF